jgi:Fungal specific transcription factor domain
MIQLDEHVDIAVSENLGAESLLDATLKATQAANPPRPIVLSARTDACLTHIFHYCPVIDPSEISANTTSVLLQQSICMLGDLIRHDSTGPVQSQQTYQRLKLLLSINYEEDCVQTLKSICLISCWGFKPSTPINVDGPWKWTGLAIQLALQMGLHREYTYTRKKNAGCLRRIFWQLYVCDLLRYL